MKKVSYFVTFIVFLVIISGSASAQTKTPTPTQRPEVTDTQIEKIKDLVASKVAELKLVEKRGTIGTVKSIAATQIVLTKENEQEVQVDIDELTKFEDTKKDFGISDISRGDSLSVVGLYNKDTKRLLARFVSLAANIPENVSGVITDKNTKTFTLSVTTLSGDEITVDVASSTKTTSFENGKVQKSGFSKLDAGARVVVIGFRDLKNKDVINASRIIYLADIAT